MYGERGKYTVRSLQFSGKMDGDEGELVRFENINFISLCATSITIVS